MDIKEVLTFFIAACWLVPCTLPAQEQADSLMSVHLDEAKAVGRAVQNKPDRVVLRVSRSMREKHMNAISMLSEIPSVRYNRVSEEVQVNGHANIAWQINGADKTAADVKALPLDAIGSMEIINTPEGRYTAEGIRYVVNVVLKENYFGTDVQVGNFLIASPAKNNGDDIVLTERPHLSAMLRTKKWNVNLLGSYGTYHWNYPLAWTKSYGGKSLQSGDVSPRHPNQLTSRREYVMQAAADFNPNERHTLSFSANYSPVKTTDQTTYNYSVSDALTGNMLYAATDLNQMERQTDDVRANMSYRGKLADKWTLTANAGYNHVADEGNSRYVWNLADARTAFTERKNYAYGKVGADVAAAEKWSFNFGGIYTYNQYVVRQAGKRQTETTNRYNAYAYATFAPSDNWELRAGVAGQGVASARENRFVVQPTVNASYASPSGKVGFEMEYAMLPEYPKLFQLTSATYAIDSLITQTGNPHLVPLSNTQQATASLMLWQSSTSALVWPTTPTG